jgi:ABC-type phosphate/phosphonate transport system substrate-binding protein
VTGRRLFLAALAALLAGYAARPRAKDRALRLGVLPVLPVRQLFRRYLPFSSHLEWTLGRPVVLETAADFPAFYARLARGEFDLASFAPHMARLAQKDLGWIPLAQFKPDGDAVLLSLKDGGADSVDELHGKTIAVPDRTALVVLVTLDALGQRDLVEGRDFRLLETRNHLSALRALETGEAAAMISRGNGFLSPIDRSRLRVLLQVDGVAGWLVMAAPELDEALRGRVRQALMQFNSSPQSFLFFAEHGYNRLAPVSEEELRKLDSLVAATRNLMHRDGD